MSLFTPSEEVKRDERIKALEEKLNALSEKNETLKLAAKVNEQALSVEKKKVQEAERRQADAIAKIKREQNEADLLFVSMKIIFELVGGKKWADVQYLLDQQMALQRHMQRSYPPDQWQQINALQRALGGIR